MATVDTGFDRGVVLAALYAAWSRELGRHWAADDATCVCGGPVSPCVAEVLAMRQIRAVEAMWRTEGAAVAARQRAEGIADESWTSGGRAAQHNARPASLAPGRWN